MSESNQRESRKRRSSAERCLLVGGKDPKRNICQRVFREEPASARPAIVIVIVSVTARKSDGGDNPRKALLTTVKEAVDNSLDACGEGVRRQKLLKL